jgi:hypothetical protein
MKKELSPSLNNVEHRLLDALLAGEDAVLAALRKQLSQATLDCRELSGSGFFLNFLVPKSVPRIGSGRIVIGDVFFDLEGVKNGGGAILFVDEGHIAMLEAYLNGPEAWPDEPRLVKVFYAMEPRNLEALRKTWAQQIDGANR